MTNPIRWPWHCGVCGSHAESYTEEGARDALDAHFRLHPQDARRPVEVAIQVPRAAWWKEHEAAILEALRGMRSATAPVSAPDPAIPVAAPRVEHAPELVASCPHPEPFWGFPEGTKYAGRRQCQQCGALMPEDAR